MNKRILSGLTALSLVLAGAGLLPDDTFLPVPETITAVAIGEDGDPGEIQISKQVIVNEGTDKNRSAPLDVSYKNTAAQYIIPAEQLKELRYESIVRLRYGVSSSATKNIEGVSVYMKEVADDVLGGFVDVSADTPVFEGTLHIEDYNMMVNLDTPFEYGSGNILVTVCKSSDTAELFPVYFEGVQQTGGCLFGRSDVSAQAVMDNIQTADFAPMTTLYCSTAPIVDGGLCGEDVEWELRRNGSLLLYGTTAMYDYELHAPWADSDKVKEVQIGPSVKSIGDNAFTNCTEIDSIVLPEELERIGKWAFKETGISSIYVPNNTVIIDKGAFKGCKSLTEVSLPKSLTTVASLAFYDCTALTSVTVPKTVETIGEKAFGYYYDSGSGKVEKIPGFTIYCYPDTAAEAYAIENGFEHRVPDPVIASGKCGDDCYWSLSDDGVLSISGTGAMYEYEELAERPWAANIDAIESIVIEDTVTSLSNAAFGECNKLKTAVLPAGLTTVSNNLFMFCDELTSAPIPDTVTVIGRGAFFSCSNLEGIKIPDGVTEIGESAFVYCEKFTDVKLPAGLQKIETSSFGYCGMSELEIPEGVTEIEGYAFLGCPELESVTIPETVTAIGDSAFYHCEKLKEVTIPASVTTIGSNAFGFVYDEETEDIVPNDIVIKGYRHSAAEAYAMENNLTFVPLDPFVCGDANGDGVIDFWDISMVQRYIAKWSDLDIDLEAADVNLDGKVDFYDLGILQRYLAKWEIPLPYVAENPDEVADS